MFSTFLIKFAPFTGRQSNFNCLLDVARETYKENVGDIFQLNRGLCEQHELPLQLVYQESGFVFSLRKTDLEASGKAELPRGFINVTAKKGKWMFESIELVSPNDGGRRRPTDRDELIALRIQKKRNARMKDALDETLMLSDRWVSRSPVALFFSCVIVESFKTWSWRSSQKSEPYIKQQKRYTLHCSRTLSSDVHE